jgi:hypothetical protein
LESGPLPNLGRESVSEKVGGVAVGARTHSLDCARPGRSLTVEISVSVNRTWVSGN